MRVAGEVAYWCGGDDEFFVEERFAEGFILVVDSPLLEEREIVLDILVVLHGGIRFYRLLRAHVEKSVAQDCLANGTLQFGKHFIGSIDSHRVGIADGEREAVLLPFCEVCHFLEGVFLTEHLRHREPMQGTR